MKETYITSIVTCENRLKEYSNKKTSIEKIFEENQIEIKQLKSKNYTYSLKRKF